MTSFREEFSCGETVSLNGCVPSHRVQDQMDTEIPMPILQRGDHKVLSTEFCSGYLDDFGEWNTGFYCPQLESPSVVISCCGTPTYKYCCTGTAPNVSEVTDASSVDGFPTVVVGHGDEDNKTTIATTVNVGPLLIETPSVWTAIVCGTVVIIVFLMLVGCYYCSCCIFHQKWATTTNPSALPLRTGRSNLRLHGLELGASSLSTTHTSSGVGSTIGSGTGHSGMHSQPPPNIVNLSSHLSTTGTPLLEIISPYRPSAGVVGVNGRDFVYSRNQWQTESVYNNSVSGSSSGIYSNPSSSNYAHPFVFPHIYSSANACGPFLMQSPDVYSAVNYNRWCYNGATFPQCPPVQYADPPPYDFRQPWLQSPRYSNPSPVSADRTTSQSSRPRQHPSPAEIALYERIFCALLKNISERGQNQSGASLKESSTLPKSTTAHKTNTSNKYENLYSTCDSQSGQQSGKLRAKSVNSIQIPDVGASSTSTPPPKALKD